MTIRITNFTESVGLHVFKLCSLIQMSTIRLIMATQILTRSSRIILPFFPPDPWHTLIGLLLQQPVKVFPLPAILRRTLLGWWMTTIYPIIRIPIHDQPATRPSSRVVITVIGVVQFTKMLDLAVVFRSSLIEELVAIYAMREVVRGAI